MGVALGIIGTIASVASTAVGVVGAIQSANAAEKAAKARADAYKYQAGVSKLNAVLTGQEGDVATENSQLKAAAIAGHMAALAAASGVDINSGSFDKVLDSTKRLATNDALTIRSNYARQVLGYQQQAELEEKAAKGANVEADMAKNAGYLNAAGSLLGGITNTVDEYTKLKSFGGLSFGGTGSSYNPAKAAFGFA